MSYLPSYIQDPGRRLEQEQARTRLGRALRDHRRKKGATQEELAEQVGVTKTTICKWERGAMTIPAHMIPSIARALEIEVNELFKGGYK